MYVFLQNRGYVETFCFFMLIFPSFFLHYEYTVLMVWSGFNTKTNSVKCSKKHRVSDHNGSLVQTQLEVVPMSRNPVVSRLQIFKTAVCSLAGRRGAELTSKSDRRMICSLESLSLITSNIQIIGFLDKRCFHLYLHSPLRNVTFMMWTWTSNNGGDLRGSLLQSG